MKKFSAKSIMIMSLAVVLTACNKGYKTFKIESNEKTIAYGLAGRLARDRYNGLTGTSIGSLNYLETQEAKNATHFANFIDGLLTHNEYGVLEKNLATKVVHNEDYTEFTFTVREGVQWQRYDGTQYEANIEGVDVPQFVVPSDWVTTTKAICTFSNGSDLDYLICQFVEGAQEYWAYTRVQNGVANKESGYRWDEGMKNNEEVANKINELIQTEAPNVWTLQYQDGAKAVEADDVPNIKNLSRLGVVADDKNMTLTYKLIQKAPYFPTLFTYSCYLPTNQYFLTETKFRNFGLDQDKILYCGPYLLSTWTENKIQYKANPGYWNVENTVTVENVNYDVITDSIDSSYTRKEFEAGRIDGFSLSMKDAEGWKKYVTGKKGQGTYDNPVDARVNARLTDTIGSMYGSNLVLARDKVTDGTTSYCKDATKDTVKNTARAFRLADVRRAILDSYDLTTFYDIRYENVDESLRQQEKVWTYVPKGFVIDDSGNDYLTHYYEVYADKNGLEPGDIENPQPGTAAYELKPGQTVTKTLSQEEVNALLEKAEQAIDLFNAENPTQAITKPINLEYYAAWFDDESKAVAQKIINSLNTRLNYGKTGDNKLFNVIPTDKLTRADYEAVSNSGNWDLSFIQWGWGADYGDPLTFMNTYIKGGDWASIFKYIALDKVDNYEINEAGTGLVNSDLLEEYTKIVNLGAQETEDFNKRFDYFAEAEYMLIEELGIYKPQVNEGQGWSLSVSRGAGYMMPTASYGLSNDRLIGYYVLDKVMKRDERNAAREKQQELKEKYLSEHDVINIY